jgi:hypothetical protein
LQFLCWSHLNDLKTLKSIPLANIQRYFSRFNDYKAIIMLFIIIINKINTPVIVVVN